MAMSKEKKKDLASVLGRIHKKFGVESISVLSDVSDKLKVQFHKTPSHEINAMLGGGFGKGKVVELFGQPGCGKTSLALEQIAKEQKENPEFVVAWLETEGSLDPSDCEMFGVDMDRFVFIEQSEDIPAEDAMDIIRGLASSGEFNMIVVNSVAALMPKKEAEDDLDKQNIALTARLLSKFLRVTTSTIAKNKCTLILINQVRTNLNSMYSTMTTTGGVAIPFYATQRIEMKREKVMAGDPISEDDGIKVRCKVVKNRLSKTNPYKVCHYYALYGKGIDNVSELGVVLVREGVLTKKGAWIRLEDESGDVVKVPSDSGEVDAKWNGNAAFTKFIREDSKGREYFEGLLNDKLQHGAVGVSVSADEIEELSNLENQCQEAGEIQDKEIEKEEK